MKASRDLGLGIGDSGVSRRAMLKASGALVVVFRSGANRRLRAGGGDTRGQSAERAGRLVVDRGRRNGNRAHRQVRDGARSLHGADAARRRRARRADGSHQVDSVRDRHDARSGSDLRRAIASAKLQPRESRARRGDRARDARADGVEAVGRAGRSTHAGERRRAASGAHDLLWRADRRQEIQHRAESECQAQSPARVDHPRQPDQAARHARDGDRPVRIRAQRSRAWDGARACRPAADRRRHGREHGE